MLSFFDDAMRWNTSCCGIEPSIMVIHAAMNHSHCLKSGGGKKLNLPASRACATTLPAPPARPETM